MRCFEGGNSNGVLSVCSTSTAKMVGVEKYEGGNFFMLLLTDLIGGWGCCSINFVSAAAFFVDFAAAVVVAVVVSSCTFSIVSVNQNCIAFIINGNLY